MSSSYRIIPGGMESDEDDTVANYETTYSHSKLKIKKMPHITNEAGLHGQNVDCSLSDDQKAIFLTCQDLFNAYKKSPMLLNELKKALLQDNQPLLLALKLFANCPGCNNLKNKNLALCIMETICDMVSQNPEIGQSFDANTSMIAFNFVKTSGIVSLYKSVLQTYQLKRIVDVLMPKIRQLIQTHNYKDAAHWALLLGVAQDFSFFDIVFPLVLQDKAILAEEYLNVVKKQQLPFVKFLDTLLDKKKTVVEHCDVYVKKYGYGDYSVNLLNNRTMSKLTARLAKKYKIDSAQTPIYNFNKSCSYLHYLFHKYRGGEMSREAWRDMVLETATTKEIQLDVVLNAEAFNDVEEAVYFAKYFKLPEELLPLDVVSMLNGVNVREELSLDGNQDVCDGLPEPADCREVHNYLSLSLHADDVKIVDTEAQFLEMIDYLQQEALIAFDTEWKPFSIGNENKIALLQLATQHRAFLIDCLSKQLTDGLWQMLGVKVFNNMEILKIGFSIQNDLIVMAKLFPLLINPLCNLSFLDMRQMWLRLKHMEILNFPFGSGSKAGEGLSDVVEVCLGKKLNKSNQCSNWVKRPLRAEQITYAALDAYCLIQIYNVISELLQRDGWDINQVVDEITTTKTGYLYRMKQASFKKLCPLAQVETEDNINCSNEHTAEKLSFIRAHKIRFLCDMMLVDLSRELRKLGFDSEDIVRGENAKHYIDLAMRENRYLITNGARFEFFSMHLPQQQCIEVPSHAGFKSVVHDLVQKFNVKLHVRNLCTRCHQCNSNAFIVALKREMFALCNRNYTASPEDEDQETKSYAYLQNKPLLMFKLNEQIMQTKKTHSGRAMKLNRVKLHILCNRNHFLICDNCGTCTWEDAHTFEPCIADLIDYDWNSFDLN